LVIIYVGWVQKVGPVFKKCPTLLSVTLCHGCHEHVAICHIPVFAHILSLYSKVLSKELSNLTVKSVCIDKGKKVKVNGI